jgi:hypothetical protein
MPTVRQYSSFYVQGTLPLFFLALCIRTLIQQSNIQPHHLLYVLGTSLILTKYRLNVKSLARKNGFLTSRIQAEMLEKSIVTSSNIFRMPPRVKSDPRYNYL